MMNMWIYERICALFCTAPREHCRWRFPAPVNVLIRPLHHHSRLFIAFITQYVWHTRRRRWRVVITIIRATAPASQPRTRVYAKPLRFVPRQPRAAAWACVTASQLQTVYYNRIKTLRYYSYNYYYYYHHHNRRRRRRDCGAVTQFAQRDPGRNQIRAAKTCKAKMTIQHNITSWWMVTYSMVLESLCEKTKTRGCYGIGNEWKILPKSKLLSVLDYIYINQS